MIQKLQFSPTEYNINILISTELAINTVVEMRIRHWSAFYE